VQALWLVWMIAAVAPAPADSVGALAAAYVAVPPRIDGRLDAGEWPDSARLTLRHQVQPGDNAAPSELTEVWIARDAEQLYVAFRGFDSEPAGVRGRVLRRDDISGDDYVRLYLDTYGDRRRAYVFTFNPLGIQADGLYNEGTAVGRSWESNIDATWDGVLASKGALTDQGYVIEAAIPFKTLRYQTGRPWGLHVSRWIARKAELVHWRPISRDASSLLVQAGSLEGLQEIASGGAVEVIPSLTASRSRARQGGRLLGASDLDPGVSGAWSLTPNLVFSAAANPDFSQIEADVPQIEVNQRFPLFYAEKRPFFLEGMPFFRSPGALTFLSTRQVVDPDWGAKLTGKIGRTSLGVLSASDRAPGLRAAPGGAGAGRNALTSVVRAQRDVLANSIVGVYVTDYRHAAARNSVLATDGNVRFAGNQVLGFQLARSFSRDASGAAREGSATYAWYEWQGRHVRLFLNDHRVASDYRSDVGFLRRTGFRANVANLGYELQPKDGKGWFVKARPFVAIRRLVASAGAVDESFVDPGLDITLPRDVSFYVYHSFHTDSFAGRRFGYDFNSVQGTIRAWKRLALEGRMQWGEAVNFDPALPVVGNSLETRLSLTLKPAPGLTSELLWLKSRLLERASGQRLFQQDVWRSRTNYQASQAHGLRGIAEWNTRTRRLSLSLLYGYTPRAHTAVFAGYGDVFADATGPDSRVRELTLQQRSFFVKLSYGYRP
jgi:hypothetical protein